MYPIYNHNFFFVGAIAPQWALASSSVTRIFVVSRSHTTTHHSRQDSSGRVSSSSQRPLPDNTQHSQQTNIHAPGGIRTYDLSRRAAVDLRLRPRGHWDQLIIIIGGILYVYIIYIYQDQHQTKYSHHQTKYIGKQVGLRTYHHPSICIDLARVSFKYDSLPLMSFFMLWYRPVLCNGNGNVVRVHTVKAYSGLACSCSHS